MVKFYKISTNSAVLDFANYDIRVLASFLPPNKNTSVCRLYATKQPPPKIFKKSRLKVNLKTWKTEKKNKSCFGISLVSFLGNLCCSWYRCHASIRIRLRSNSCSSHIHSGLRPSDRSRRETGHLRHYLRYAESQSTGPSCCKHFVFNWAVKWVGGIVWLLNWQQKGKIGKENYTPGVLVLGRDQTPCNSILVRIRSCSFVFSLWKRENLGFDWHFLVCKFRIIRASI